MAIDDPRNLHGGDEVEWQPYYRGYDEWGPRASVTEPRRSKASIVSILWTLIKAAVVGWVVWLLLGGCYVYVYQWHTLEDPHYDLLIVNKHDPAELAFFRKKTVPDFIDPALRQLENLVELRKESRSGMVVPADYALRCEAIDDKLSDIMHGARLRQIPKKFAKDYKDALLGISQAHRSLRAYEKGMAPYVEPIERDKAFDESIAYSKKARNNLEKARRIFH